MSVRTYLPSSQFSSIVFSVLGAGGLVFAAHYVTEPHYATLHASQGAATEVSDWQSALNAIQVQQDTSLPAPPDESAVNELRAGVQSSNLTDSVARTLLINVTDAKAQGLGGDLPTQNQLLNAALSQISQTSQPTKQLQITDLTIVPTSKDAEHAYGNAIIAALTKHPQASIGDTFKILGDQINGVSNHLADLAKVQKDYQALAADLARVPVPVSLAEQHLALINGYLQMADTFPNMEALATDPLRALAGLQLFTNSSSNLGQVFINIGQIFDKDGILFSKDEPGAGWSSLLSGQ